VLTDLGTWNALGQQLTEEKVLTAVETLAKNNINVTNFIIDDNWQSIDVMVSFSMGGLSSRLSGKLSPMG
jgi:alpha-galactosidase